MTNTGHTQETATETEVESYGLDTTWRYRGTALMVADFMLVVAGFLLAFCGRIYLQPVFERHLAPHRAVQTITWEQVDSYLKGAVLLAVVWVALIWRAGGYESGLRGIASPIIRMRLVLVAGVKAFAILMVLSYMYRGTLHSRPVYLMTAVLSLGSLTLVRLLFLALDRDLGAQKLALQHVLLVGLDSQTEDFARRLDETGSTVRIAGFLTADGGAQPDSFAGYPVLGRLDQIQDIYERRPFDKLVLSHSVISSAGDEMGATRMIRTVNFCEANGISLYTLPNVLNMAITQNEVGSLSGVPLIRLKDAALHPGYAVAKRLMDIVVSMAGIVAGVVIWLPVALLIKFTSRGPVLFTQIRIGLHGRPFTIYKFRTMVPDAEERLKDLVDIDSLKVPGFKIKDDPRVTTVGGFLRRTSLDEIPQLLNVLKGEMSLVGPRPELAALVARYTPEQRRRLKAKPGITGYQQVRARGIPLAEGIEYDLVYLKHQSFLLDLYVLVKTVAVVVRGSGVTH